MLFKATYIDDLNKTKPIATQQHNVHIITASYAIKLAYNKKNRSHFSPYDDWPNLSCNSQLAQTEEKRK